MSDATRAFTEAVQRLGAEPELAAVRFDTGSWPPRAYGQRIRVRLQPDHRLIDALLLVALTDVLGGTVLNNDPARATLEVQLPTADTGTGTHSPIDVQEVPPRGLPGQTSAS